MKLAAWAAAGDVHKAALHPLITALTDILGRFQEGVVAQAFGRPVEIEIELQTGGKRFGLAELALEGGILGDSAFPCGEGRSPRQRLKDRGWKSPDVSAGVTSLGEGVV